MINFAAGNLGIFLFDLLLNALDSKKVSLVGLAVPVENPLMFTAIRFDGDS